MKRFYGVPSERAVRQALASLLASPVCPRKRALRIWRLMHHVRRGSKLHRVLLDQLVQTTHRHK